MRLLQECVGWHTVSFREYNQIATGHFATRNTSAFPATDYERPRTSEIAQRLQYAFGARLLDHRDRHGNGGERQQKNRLVQVTQKKVD